MFDEKLNVLASTMNDASKSHLHLKATFKELDIDEIVENPQNNLNYDKVDLYVDSIARIGLITPLTVAKLDDGMYQLVSGHTRLRAIKKLREQGADVFDFVPCHIVNKNYNQDDVTEMLLASNNQREFTPEEKANLIQMAESLYETKKQNGHIPLGLHKRAFVMQATGFSEAEVRGRKKKAQKPKAEPTYGDLVKLLKKANNKALDMMDEHDIEMQHELKQKLNDIFKLIRRLPDNDR